MTTHNGRRLDAIDLPRVVEIDRLLARRDGTTVRELAERFGVTKKTVYRDLATLKIVYGRRLRVTLEAGGRKRYRIGPQDRAFSPWLAARTHLLQASDED